MCSTSRTAWRAPRPTRCCRLYVSTSHWAAVGLRSSRPPPAKADNSIMAELPQEEERAGVLAALLEQSPDGNFFGGRRMALIAGVVVAAILVVLLLRSGND